MANERIFRVARLTDKQVISLIEKLHILLPTGAPNISFGSNLSVSLANFSELKLSRNSHGIVSATTGTSDLDVRIDFRRGISSETGFETRAPSSIADEIRISVNSHARRNHSYREASITDYLEIVQVIEKNTKPLSIAPVDGTLSDTSILQAELQKLSELATELTVGADEKRRELDTKIDELSEKHNEKEANLAKEFEAKEAVLVEKRSELEKLRNELDDREHKHVRRELRETITEDIQTKIEKPSRQGGAIYTTASMYIAAIAAFGLGYLTLDTQVIISNLDLNTQAVGPSFYLLYLKMILSGAGTVGFVVYIVSWLRSMAEREISYRRKLEQYVFDMNRASWTIETMLELSDSEMSEVPQTWLDSVTNNLFESGDAKNEDASSLQALGALLNVTSEAEIGPDGPKFKLNRKGAKKAASEG